jgi:hypothetical protein
MLAARQVGTQAPDSAATAWLKSLYSAECALPKCWQGLEIGKTTVREAIEALRKNPSLQVEVHHFNDNWLVQIYFQISLHQVRVIFSGLPDAPIPPHTLWLYLPEQALTIGEVFAALGTPKQTWKCGTCPVDYYVLNDVQIVTYPSDRFTPYVSIQSLNVLPETGSQ